MRKTPFKTESKRLLDLMVNAVYTHREIFLRELISNASDAIDKRYYSAMQRDKAGMDRADFEIRLAADEQARTLSVTDNGCGMSREELSANLGTIAASGTRAFREEHKGEEDLAVIGQFGVGFYAAFMVAKTVQVRTRKEDGEGFVWESDGVDGYTIRPEDGLPVGTSVVLSLKDNEEGQNYDEFLKAYRLKALVRKYSDYICYPIRMLEAPAAQEDDLGASEDAAPGAPTDKTLNSMVPLWRKNKSEITKEEYEAFYRENFYDTEPPEVALHVRAEGTVSYNALLFVSRKPPADYFTKGYERGLKLYANGVMIMDACEDLLPEYFGFVRGLVDSPDLSLNISRELLQHDRQLSLIANNLKKKLQQELLRIQRDERERYENIFAAYARPIKYGLYQEFGMNRELLQDLLLYQSAQSEKLVTLNEYVDAMPAEQEKIYYATGETVATARKLPQTQAILGKGPDVLCMGDDVDEFVVKVLFAYREHEFQSVADAGAELATDEEKAAMEQEKKDSADLLARVKTALTGKVSEVRLSHSLGETVACLACEGGLSVEMVKVLRSMPDQPELPVEFVLELNPTHALFAKLDGLDEATLGEYAALLYDQAMLCAGIPIEDPFAFSERVCKYL